MKLTVEVKRRNAARSIRKREKVIVKGVLSCDVVIVFIIIYKVYVLRTNFSYGTLPNIALEVIIMFFIPFNS